MPEMGRCLLGCSEVALTLCSFYSCHYRLSSPSPPLSAQRHSQSLWYVRLIGTLFGDNLSLPPLCISVQK